MHRALLIGRSCRPLHPHALPGGGGHCRSISWGWRRGSAPTGASWSGHRVAGGVCLLDRAVPMDPLHHDPGSQPGPEGVGEAEAPKVLGTAWLAAPCGARFIEAPKLLDRHRRHPARTAPAGSPRRSCRSAAGWSVSSCRESVVWLAVPAPPQCTAIFRSIAGRFVPFDCNKSGAEISSRLRRCWRP
jgi:hypothetical protein